MNFLAELQASAARFPYIQFILGAALLFGVVASVLEIKVEIAYVALTAILVLMFMFCLVLFRAITKLPEGHFRLPIIVMVWFFTATLIVSVTGALAYVGQKVFRDSPRQTAVPAMDASKKDAVKPPDAPAPDVPPVAAQRERGPNAGSVSRNRIVDRKPETVGAIPEHRAETSPEVPNTSPTTTASKNLPRTPGNCREIAAMDFSKIPPSFSKTIHCD